MMKRYKGNEELFQPGKPLMIEDPEGGWVKRKDVKNAIRVTTERFCSCGGGGPHDNICDVCKIYHWMNQMIEVE